MEVLKIKPIKNKKITAYIFKKDKQDLPYSNIEKFCEFIKNNGINFITIDFEIDLMEFRKTDYAQALNKMGISYYQVDIPEFAMGYTYENIMKKEEQFNELVEEYENMEDRDSYKGQCLKNWIDMLHDEIEEMENFLSLKLRPLWIVKKMLDIAKSHKSDVISFIHLVQEDICEDICSEVVEQLRNLNVKVIQYNKKHTIKQLIF